MGSLADVSTSEKLFQSVNEFAQNNNFVGGFPTFLTAPSNGTTVFGAVLIKQGQAGLGSPVLIPVQQAHGSDIGEWFDLTNRLGSVQQYAAAQGFVAGLPTFIDRDFGRGTHFGTILFTADQAEHRDIPASELGPVPTSDERFRAVARWVATRGFVGGFPNFFEAAYNGVKVYGTILFKSPAAEWRDLPFAQLPPFNNLADRMIVVSDWAVNAGFFSGFPNYYDGANREVGSVLIHLGYATWKDLPMSQLVFG